MNLPIEIIIGALTILAVVIGLVWRGLNIRVEKIEKILENNIVTLDHCTLKNQNTNDRIGGISSRLDDFKTDNKEDHEALGKTLETMCDTLTGIRECITKLSAGINCD